MMQTIEQIQVPRVGDEGEPCRGCRAPLAADQRYCLNCGRRRGEARVPFEKHLRGAGPDATTSPPANGAATLTPTAISGAPKKDWTAAWLAGGMAALGLMLIIGVLIGRDNGGTPVAATPQVVQAAPTGSTASTASGGETVANGPFVSDWPSGKTGFTIELGSLAKSDVTPAEVEVSKADSTSKGATDVGALDSDDFASLPSGNYIIYSGVFDTKAEAEKQLKVLSSSFPDATVVEVSDKAAGGKQSSTGGGSASKNTVPVDTGDATVVDTSQLDDLANCSGAECVKKADALGDEIATPGEAPPTDNKAPGGASGGDALVIK